MSKKAKKSKATIIVYIVLRVLVVAVMIAQVFNGNWGNVFICLFVLLLFMLPTILSKRLQIVLPSALEIIIVLFIFAAEILGEVKEYYIAFDKWDDMLHTTNGFLAAAIGFALIDMLNRSDKVKLTLSPWFVALVAFCFSMTVAVIWEFFEFSMDYWFGQDMQKDTWIDTFNTVSLNPTGNNEPVNVDVESVVLNGEVLTKGYLDIGLFDTMHDMWVNFIGAVIFSILGLIFIKNKGHGFAEKFIPRLEEKE